MADVITVKGKALDPGCYVDGHWGQYGSSRVLRIADDLLGTDYVRQAGEIRECERCHTQTTTPDGDNGHCHVGSSKNPPMRTFDSHEWITPEGIATDEFPSGEIVVDLADEAESALNDVTHNGAWGWHEGEFFLSTLEDLYGDDE